MKNFTAAHLPVAAAPVAPYWHAFGMRAAVAVAGAVQGVDVLTRGTGIAGATTVVDKKRTTTPLVDPAPSSPPV